jgi:hypothetical protein
MKAPVLLSALVLSVVSCSPPGEDLLPADQVEAHNPQPIFPTWTSCGDGVLRPGDIYIFLDPELHQHPGQDYRCRKASVLGNSGCITATNLNTAGFGPSPSGLGYPIQSFMWSTTYGINAYEKTDCTYTAVLNNRRSFTPGNNWVTHSESWAFRTGGTPWNYPSVNLIGSFYVAN